MLYKYFKIITNLDGLKKVVRNLSVIDNSVKVHNSLNRPDNVS